MHPVEGRSITPAGKLRMVHAGWAGAALLLSLAVHWAAVWKLPDVRFAALPDVSAMPRYEPVRLGSVTPEPPPAPDAVERFRPEDPAAVSEFWSEWSAGDAGSFSAPPDENVAAAPDVEAEAPPTDRPPPAFSRQEVRAVQERLLRDDVAALPRAFAPDIPRADIAPDIALPADIPDTFEPESGGSSFGFSSSSDIPLVSFASTGDPAGDLKTGAGDPALDALAGELDEAPGEVTDVEPIEDLLEVDLERYQPAGDDWVYFRLQIQRAGEGSLPVLPRDLLFVQDCSESISPWKLADFRRGLRRWLEHVDAGDRIEILEFRDAITPCFNRWVKATPGNLDRAREFIGDMRSRGNTDVYASLQAALDIPRDPARPMLVILATDGRPTTGVTGSIDIIDRISRENDGSVSIFAVGGGDRVNTFFLDLLSYRNRGEARVAADEDQIPGAMEEWARQLGRPVLTDLRYQFAGIDSAEVYPRTLTHLYLDRPLQIVGRVPAGGSRIAFQVIGRSGDRQHDMIFDLDLAEAASGNRTLVDFWAWQKIYDMIGLYIQSPSDELLGDIQDMADRYGMVVPYGFSRTVPR